MLNASYDGSIPLGGLWAPDVDAMAPEHQLLYLQILSGAARKSAEEACEAVRAAELSVSWGVEKGWTLDRLNELGDLQRRAVARLQSVAVHGRLYLAALRQYQAMSAPVVAWDEGMR